MISIADWTAHVGLDYHNCFVQVCVLDAAGAVLGNRRIDNSVTAIGEFVSNVSDGRLIGGVAVEACCGSSNLAEALREVHQWNVDLAHAGTCAKMKMNPDKSDLGDAHLLADLCRVGYVPRVWLPPKEIRDLRRHRQQLVEQRRVIKLRIRAMLREERIEAPTEAGNVWTKSWFKWLRETTQLDGHSRWVMDNHLEDLDRIVTKVKAVEARMEEATAEDPVVQKLRATKGTRAVRARAVFGG